MDFGMGVGSNWTLLAQVGKKPPNQVMDQMWKTEKNQKKGKSFYHSAIFKQAKRITMDPITVNIQLSKIDQEYPSNVANFNFF